jgi:hypothetical protein
MRISRGVVGTASIVSSFHLLVSPSALSEPRQIFPPWPEASLGNYRWNQPMWPEHRTLNEDSATYAESWSGYALRRDSLTTALPVVIPGGIVDGRSRLAAEHGAVRCWVSPNWSSASEKGEGKGPGHYARLLELVNWGGAKPTTHWSLYVSEDGSAIYFSGQGKAGATDLLKVPIACQAGEWAAVTVCYSPSNSALWLNDQLLAEGEGVGAATYADASAFGLVIGSDIGAASPAEAQFEDLTVFDYWPSEKQQASYYKAMKKRAILGPVGTEEEEQAKQEMMQMMELGEPPVPGEGEGGEGDEGGTIQAAYDYPASNYLWLEITSVTNGTTPTGLAYVTLHGTVPGTAYELLSKEALTNTIWASEGVVIGAEAQDWTPTVIGIGSRTNSLFLWARSWMDSDGDGLPDWYEHEVTGTDPNNPDTGNTGVSDGYKDGDNDGWTNLQEYQNGTNPNSFNTPAAPDGLVVTLVSTGLHANLTWQPARGAVTGYTLERSFTNVSTQVSSSSTSFADNSHTLPTGVYFTVPKYRIQANYASGNSAWGAWTSSSESVPPEAGIHAGQSEQVPVTTANIATEASVLRAGQWLDGGGGPYSLTNVDLPIAQFTNGIALLSEPFASLTSTGNWYLQWISSNGVASASVWSPTTIPLWDGRQQLKQNLRFLLRAATINYSFGYNYDDGEFAPYFISSPTNYAYAGLYETYYWAIPTGYPDAYLEPFRPFDENHRYRNFAFSATNLNSFGHLTTGVYWDSGLIATLDYPPLHRFTPPTGSGTIPSLLGSAESQWLYWTEFVPDSLGDWSEMGISYQAPNFLMATGARNLFGLPYQSVKQAWGNSASSTSTLNAGGSTTGHDGFFYPETTQPLFQTAGYYFGRSWMDWLPGHVPFSPTNTTPLLITSVGQAMQIAGYAKLAVTNGYAGTFGFLGQYFDRAYTVGTNGVATTNATGLLSPYGDFFPTQPGPAALVTLPDLETGERGTCMVHVIKLQLDVNHDGVMDLSFGGPDNTSANRPFVFWVNNDRDLYEKDLDTPNGHNYDDNAINGFRDLEDFARLWVSGLPALPSAQGYSISLSWRNATGNPSIKLYRAYETNGGTAYLQDTNIALQQVLYSAFPGVGGYGGSIGAVSLPGPFGAGPFTFPSNYFAVQGTNTHFLFEGAGIGSGELVLTISKGTNTVAETSAWFDLRDIKDMYEQVDIRNVTDATPNTLTSTYHETKVLSDDASEDKSVILFVHGWRMGVWDYHSFSESMFKRLYWQGFKGRFAALRWPTLSKDTDGPVGQFATYNRSEFRAFQSARGVSDYLAHLRQRFPDRSINVAAHSMGGIVMAEALKRDVGLGRRSINHLVIMQAAVPAHCYDTTLPNYVPFVSAETNILSMPTPDTYRGYPGAINGAVSNSIVNFFNTNDYALATGVYGGQQVSWEQNQKTYKPDQGFGYSSDGTNAFKSFVLVTDPRQIMAFVARPRSKAVGALPDVNGAIQGGQLDLKANFGFDTDMGEHSAQFNWNIHRLAGFYTSLLDAFSSP